MAFCPDPHNSAQDANQHAMNTYGDFNSDDEASSAREYSEISSAPSSPTAISESSHCSSSLDPESQSLIRLREDQETLPKPGHNPIAAMRQSKQVDNPSIEPEIRESSISGVSEFDPSDYPHLEQTSPNNSMLRSATTYLDDEVKESPPSNNSMLKRKRRGSLFLTESAKSNESHTKVLGEAMAIARYLSSNVRKDLHPKVKELITALRKAMALMDRVEAPKTKSKGKGKKRKARKKKKKKHIEDEVSEYGVLERRNSLKPSEARRLSLSKKH